MHSKRRYKICICSVVQGQLESFRNYKGLLLFSRKFRCNFKFYKSDNFSDSSLNPIFESENIRVPFSTKNRLTWVLKCEKLNFIENRREFIRYITKIVHEWNGHLEIFSLPQAIENSRQFLLLRTDILQKTVLGCPWPSKVYVQYPAGP